MAPSTNHRSTTVAPAINSLIYLFDSTDVVHQSIPLYRWPVITTPLRLSFITDWVSVALFKLHENTAAQRDKNKKKLKKENNCTCLFSTFFTAIDSNRLFYRSIVTPYCGSHNWRSNSIRIYVKIEQGRPPPPAPPSSVVSSNYDGCINNIATPADVTYYSPDA